MTTSTKLTSEFSRIHGYALYVYHADPRLPSVHILCLCCTCAPLNLLSRSLQFLYYFVFQVEWWDLCIALLSKIWGSQAFFYKWYCNAGYDVMLSSESVPIFHEIELPPSSSSSSSLSLSSFPLYWGRRQQYRGKVGAFLHGALYRMTSKFVIVIFTL